MQLKMSSDKSHCRYSLHCVVKQSLVTACLSLGCIREDLLGRGEPEEKDVPFIGLGAMEQVICAVQSIQYPQCAIVLAESMVKVETAEMMIGMG